jgi:hypothetical protein
LALNKDGMVNLSVSKQEILSCKNGCLLFAHRKFIFDLIFMRFFLMNSLGNPFQKNAYGYVTFTVFEIKGIKENHILDRLTQRVM